MDSLLLNITISSTYQPLDIPFAADIGNLLIFATFFGLSMAVYPAFLGLYPTVERLRGIRSMHYSNGVYALPLWLAYLVFDFMVTLTVSAVATIIFRPITDIWYYLEYMFLIFLLYGIASTLFSYVLSLFVKSQLAVFALTAGIQCGMYLVFLITYMATLTYTDPSSQNSVFNTAYYTLGIVSPACSLSRAFYLTINLFGLACRGREIAPYPGAIDVFGGPILYLILQSLFFFSILLWKDSGLGFRRRPKKTKRTVGGDGAETFELESGLGSARTPASNDDCLQVLRLRKKFKRHVAVDDVSFSVPRG